MKYDAFISYKHRELDSKAVMALQKNLEHLRVPKGIDTKKKRIERVFVDEGELSSSSYFSQEIKDALKNAEWLIVMCSKGTRQSGWVNLEIRTFLETHDRSQILAVIIEGEPKEVYPDELLGKSSLEDEVLAADARGKDTKEVLRKLKKDALLKVAAPILGTSFDSLKQRRKSYVIQRVSAIVITILCVVLAAAIYAMKQSQTIAEQALNINKEQAKYLTQQAEIYLDGNDRRAAIELAIEALGTVETNQEIDPDTEYVLSRAVGAYTTAEGSGLRMFARGSFDVGHKDNLGFFVDPQGKYLFTVDQEYLYVWDTQNYEVAHTIQLKWSMSDFSNEMLIGNGEMIVPTSQIITCYDYASGNEKWSSEVDSVIKEFVVSEDGKTIVLLTHDEIVWIDRNSGKILSEKGINEELIEHLACSNDLNWIVFASSERISDDFEYNSYVHIYDTKNDHFQKVLIGKETISKLYITEDNQLIVSADEGTVMVLTDRRDTQQGYYEKLKTNLFCLSLDEGELIWEHQEDYVELGDYVSLKEITYKNKNQKVDALLYMYSNSCIIMDKHSGKLLIKHEFPSVIKAEVPDEEELGVITKDGKYIHSDYSQESWLYIQWFPKEIQDIDISGKTYYVRNLKNEEKTDTIVKYQMDFYDKNYEEIYQEKRDISLDDYMGNGWYVFFDEEGKLCLLDSKKGVEEKVELSGNAQSYTILGLSDEKAKLYLIKEEDRPILVEVDLTTKNSTECKFIEDDAALKAVDYAFVNGKVMCLTGTILPGKEIISVCTWDGGETTIGKVGEYVSEDNNKFLDYETDTFTADSKGEIYTFLLKELIKNEESGDVSQMDLQEYIVFMRAGREEFIKVSLEENGLQEDDFKNYKCIWDSSNQQFAIENHGKILVLNRDGEKEQFIDIGSDKLVDIFFSPNGNTIIALDEQGFIYQYEVKTGKQLNNIEVSEIAECYYYGKRKYIIDESTMLFAADSKGGVLLNVEPENFGVKSYISGCVGYEKEQDMFYVFDSDRRHIGGFKRYTTSELIQMGKEIIGK